MSVFQIIKFLDYQAVRMAGCRSANIICYTQYVCYCLQGVELSEDQIELPDEPVTSPKQITIYLTVCSHFFQLFH